MMTLEIGAVEHLVGCVQLFLVKSDEHALTDSFSLRSAEILKQWE